MERPVEANRDLLKRYHSQSHKHFELVLSDELYEQAGTLLKDNIYWMYPDDNYFLLFLVWINGEGADPREPRERQLYRFKITAGQIKYLKDYQHESYKTPRVEGISDGNRFINYAAFPELIKVVDESTAKAVYDSIRDRVMMLTNK